MVYPPIDGDGHPSKY